MTIMFDNEYYYFGILFVLFAVVLGVAFRFLVLLGVI